MGIGRGRGNKGIDRCDTTTVEYSNNSYRIGTGRGRGNKGKDKCDTTTVKYSKNNNRIEREGG